MAAVASPSAAARGEVEGDGDGGELALVVDGERGGSRFEMRECRQRHLRPAGGNDVHAFQSASGCHLILRIDFEHDVVLVQRVCKWWKPARWPKAS